MIAWLNTVKTIVLFLLRRVPPSQTLFCFDFIKRGGVIIGQVGLGHVQDARKVQLSSNCFRYVYICSCFINHPMKIINGSSIQYVQLQIIPFSNWKCERFKFPHSIPTILTMGDFNPNYPQLISFPLTYNPNRVRRTC